MTREADCQPGPGRSCTALGHPQPHVEASLCVHRIGIEPMHVQFLNGGQTFCRVPFIEGSVQTAITDRIEDQAMLIPKNLLFLLVGEPSRSPLVCIRCGALAYAASSYKDLGLQEQLIFACFALHVINSVAMLHIGIEAKDHAILFNKANLEEPVGALGLTLP